MGLLIDGMGRLMWPSGRRGRLAVLMYHRVLPSPDPLRPWEVDRVQFEGQMRLLRDRFQVLPLNEGVACLLEGSLPPLAVAITFDDGYSDNYEHALPILMRYGLPASFFAATGYLNGGCMWNDLVIEAVRRTEDVLDLEEAGLGRHAVATIPEKLTAIKALLPKIKYLPFSARTELSAELAARASVDGTTDIMMTSAQVRALREAGMGIGAHTVRHPILANEPLEDVRRDIVESKRYLEDLLQEPVEIFAYPNGRPGKDYRAEHVQLLKQAGFRCAVSTAWGIAGRGADPYQIPRLLPWERDIRRFHVRILRTLWDRPAG